MPNSTSDGGRVATSFIRAPQKFVAGALLIAISLFVLWAVSNLTMGSVKFMGAAMFPRSLAVVIGLCGLALLVDSFLRDGPGIEAWSYRGPGLVFASILLFAFTIRPFGLTVASMLALVVSGYATDEARPKEVVIFAAAITFCCVIIFRYVLGMSVSVFAIPGTSIGF